MKFRNHKETILAGKVKIFAPFVDFLGNNSVKDKLFWVEFLKIYAETANF